MNATANQSRGKKSKRISAFNTNPVYTIEFKPSALKQLYKLPRLAGIRAAEKIDRLARNPRPPGVEKMSGYKDYYRIRVGDYRVIYSIKDDILLVLVVRIGARKDVYRDF